MKRIAIQFVSIILFIILFASSAKAQFQFCFGMSPGLSKTFPSHPFEDVTLPFKASITLQAGMNYSLSRKVSLMSLISFSEYTEPFIPTWEVEINGAYNYPVSKRVRFKSSAGVAATFLKNSGVTSISNLSSQPSLIFTSKDNFFAVIKSGVQWKAPGNYHSVYFGFEYHWGALRAHQAIYYYSDHTLPAASVRGRGSYLALNLLIFIGKEKYGWKKAKSENEKQKSFVM